jgi:hypothetical protein
MRSEPSGKCEGTEKWTRDIQGFSGLVAIQAKGEAPVLELVDLQGDMIGTASISETESKLVANEPTSAEDKGTHYQDDEGYARRWRPQGF